MYTRKFIDITAELKHPVAVVGLPGIANVGRISVETLIEVLNAEPVMQFFCSDFPPQVMVHDGITKMPKSSLYLYRSAPDEPHDVFFLTADYQPGNSRGVFEYADFIVREFATYGVEEVIALAAYEQDYAAYFDQFPAEPRVFVSASDQQLLDALSLISGVVSMKQGVINGANGIIPTWAATMYDMKGACLLGETIGILKMDYRAARMAIAVFGDLVGLKTPLDALDEQAEQVVEFLGWAKDEMEQQGKQMQDEETRPDRYIG
ncbi:MAG: PAC2 family protein [Candidatus Thorarchaeota archaeon]|nr:PAC2 family protein [Candidatus Thorarchaeota archaeon]